MMNIHENDTTENRAEINTDEMDTLRDIMMLIVEYGLAGTNIIDEIGHLLEALSVADRKSVCFVANFVASGRQGEAEDDCTEGGATLLPTWDTLLEHLIPWLERRGYEKRGNLWQLSSNA
jgi:hypothetical protein